MECIWEGAFKKKKKKTFKKTKNLSSQTFLDCFTTRRKPYSQSIAQRSKQKGDFFQRFSGVWTVQLEIRFFVFYLMDFCKWRGGGRGL